MASAGKENTYETDDFAEYEIDIPITKAGSLSRRIAKYVGDIDFVEVAEMFPGFTRYKVAVSSCEQISNLLHCVEKYKLTADADSPFRRILMKCSILSRSKLLLRLFQDRCIANGITIMMEKEPKDIPFEIAVAEDIKVVIKFLEEYSLVNWAIMCGTNDKADCAYVNFNEMVLK